jgi:hypothetical protein
MGTPNLQDKIQSTEGLNRKEDGQDKPDHHVEKKIVPGLRFYAQA